MTPFLGSFLITNYLTTCFGWRLLPSLALEPPSFTGGLFLGGYSFLAAWMVTSLSALSKGDHRRAKRQPWSTFVQEAIFDGEAVGWAVTVQLAMCILSRAVAIH